MQKRREYVVIGQGPLLVAVPVELVIMLLADDQVEPCGSGALLPALGSVRCDDGHEGPAFDLGVWMGAAGDMGTVAAHAQWLRLRDGSLWRTGRIIDIERLEVGNAVCIPARIPLLAVVRRQTPIYLVEPGYGLLVGKGAMA
jgi:hypothetical protein